MSTMMPPPRRYVFFVSDRTGITAEMLGNSLLSQFEDFQFVRETIPFVDSPDQRSRLTREPDADRVQLDRRRNGERHAAP